MERYLTPFLDKDLRNLRQMVFLTGPRQVGKTTVAKELLQKHAASGNYFNWDNREDRETLLRKIFPGKVPPPKGLLCFDEIHKYKRWKNTLKGLFDKHEPNTHWIVTGSARLDVYRRGQDSMVGRYFSYHLCPLSVGELAGDHRNHGVLRPSSLGQDFRLTEKAQSEAFESLLTFGGFPEPFLKMDHSFLRKWRSTRLERLIHQDLAALEQLKNLSLVENLLFLLPDRVGSPLSINALREDLEVHFATVKHWLCLLENVFYGFRITTYSKKKTRMLKKESKFYLWDWTEVNDPGARFENMVAAHLMKYIHLLNETGAGDYALHYIKDREKREVDFVLCENRKPVCAIECKLSDTGEAYHHLRYYADLLGIAETYVIIQKLKEPMARLQDGRPIHVVSGASFLAQLP